MFSQASVILSTGGVHPPQADTHTPGRHPPGQTHSRHPPWADTLPRADTPLGIPSLGRHPLGRHPPPPRDDHCSGRYASYWNAFLSLVNNTIISLNGYHCLLYGEGNGENSLYASTVVPPRIIMTPFTYNFRSHFK